MVHVLVLHGHVDRVHGLIWEVDQSRVEEAEARVMMVVSALFGDHRDGRVEAVSAIFLNLGNCQNSPLAEIGIFSYRIVVGDFYCRLSEDDDRRRVCDP